MAVSERPSIDLSEDAMAWSGKFSEAELQAGREKELQNMLDFDAFEKVEVLPAGQKAYDMVWVDEWCGGAVRSRLCVRQFKAEQARDDIFAGTLETFFMRYLVAKAATEFDMGILIVDISVAFMHARTDEDIYVKPPRDVKSSPFWKLKAAINGTRKASQQWQDYSAEKMQEMGFERSDLNPCIYRDPERDLIGGRAWRRLLDHREDQGPGRVEAQVRETLLGQASGDRSDCARVRSRRALPQEEDLC